MTTSPEQAPPTGSQSGQRAQQPEQEFTKHVAPIRWPRPDGATLAAVGVWVVGLLVAIGLPAALVPPGQDSATGGEVAGALSLTLLGAAVMLAAAVFLARRSRESAVLALGVVPAVAAVVCGIIVAATLLAG